MEPTKNTNLNTGMNGASGMGGTNGMGGNGANNEPSESAFRGMPKPGEPLTSTPRVNATPSITPTQTYGSAFANQSGQSSGSSQSVDSHPTFAQVMASKGGTINTPTTSSGVAPTTHTPTSSFRPAAPVAPSTPSALDRLMNPSIGKDPISNPVPTPPTPIAQPPVTPKSAFANPTPVASIPVTPSPSTFKPYTPPTYSAPTPVSPVSNSTQSPISPTHNTSTPPTSSGVYSSAYSSPIAPAPSASVTAAKLNSEVHSMLNPQQAQTGAKKSNGNGPVIIGLVALLLLLGGGGYYWYTYMYLPNRDATTTQEDDAFGQPDTSSSFPTSATKPVTTVPNTSTKPATTVTTPAKPARVVTPFTQAQRRAVSAYIVANINNLATTSDGPYEVTDVTFDGPDRAVVQYTNGTYSYTAVAVASIDTSNNVRIVSFTLLEK